MERITCPVSALSYVLCVCVCVPVGARLQCQDLHEGIQRNRDGRIVLSIGNMYIRMSFVICRGEL